MLAAHPSCSELVEGLGQASQMARQAHHDPAQLSEEI